MGPVPVCLSELAKVQDLRFATSANLNQNNWLFFYFSSQFIPSLLQYNHFNFKITTFFHKKYQKNEPKFGECQVFLQNLKFYAL